MNSVRSDSSSSRKHRSPVRQALNQGATSLTVDVWFVDGELLVGSDASSLVLEETLSDLYLDPFLEVFASPTDTTASRRSSIHRRRSSASAFSYVTATSPFKLFLKLRSSPATTFPFLLHALTPLHDASLLTSFCPNSNLTTPGLLTVIISGEHNELDVPLDDITSLTPRYVFAELGWDEFRTKSSQGGVIKKEVTPVVRAQWSRDAAVGREEVWDGMKPASEETISKLKKMIELAHSHGLLMRFVDVPMFPSHGRELVKATLHDLGADLL